MKALLKVEKILGIQPIYCIVYNIPLRHKEFSTIPVGKLINESNFNDMCPIKWFSG